MSKENEKSRLQSDLSTSIKAFRKSRGLSQDNLAKIAGVDRKTINRIENGKHSPSLENFVSISNALDCAPEELMRLIVSGEKYSKN